MASTTTETAPGGNPEGKTPSSDGSVPSDAVMSKVSNQSTQNTTPEESSESDEGLQKHPTLNIGGAVSRSIGKKLRKKMEEKAATKRKAHPAALRGWKELTGYDTSYELKQTDQIMDLLTRSTTLDEYLPEFLYGDWYHGVAVIIVTALLCATLGKYKFNLGFVFIITFFAAGYYRSSIRKYRLSLRLEAQREFSAHAIEDDFESLDWLNVFLDKYWIYLEPSISQQITEIVNPMVAQLDAIPAFVKEVWIHTLSLGTKPFRIDKVRTLDRTGDDVTVMDWTVSMIPNVMEDSTAKQMKNKANLTVLVKAKMFGMTIPILVSDVSFKVNARVRIRMMANFPHIQSVNVSLSETPEYDFVAKPVGSDTIFGFEIMNIPGLLLLTKEMVRKYLGPMLFVPLSFQLNIEQLLAGNGMTGALGVLEIKVKNAKNLQGADTFNNTIDPYFTFEFIGDVKAQTKVVFDNINPVYNETLRIILNSSSDPLIIKLYDENVSDGRKDKFMGAALFDLEELVSKGSIENVSIPVLRNNHPAGTFNFDIKLMKSLQGVKLPDGSYTPPPDYNTGIAKLTLSGAREYASDDKKDKKSVYAQVYISGEKKVESPVAKNSDSASWNCKFEDIVYDRSKSRVKVILREKSDNKIIGSTTLRLVDIIDASYVGNTWFSMNAGVGEVDLSCNWSSVKISGVPGDIGYNEPVGVLRVYIEKAEDLMNLEMIGVIDPYVRVLVNGIQRGRTLTQDSTTNPKFFESIYIPISSVNQRITLEAMDVERRTQDRTLGSFQIRLNEFVDYNAKGEPIETQGELKEAVLYHKRKGAKGTITYSLQFYPILQVSTPIEMEREKKDAADLAAKLKAEEDKANDKKLKDEKEANEESSDEEAADAKANENNGMEMDSKPKKVLTVSDLVNYDTGVLIITVLGSTFSSSGYLQIFFDKKGHPSYETKVTQRTNLRFTFDYLIKELHKYSIITLRIVEKPNQTLLKSSSNEVTMPTLAFLENTYGRTTALKLSESNVLQLSSKFMPAMFSELPPADSIGNSGTLKLEIVKAINLLSKDSNGKSDPFVKAYLNGEEFYKTKTKKKTLDPVWDESTTTSVDSRVQSVLRFKVSDWDFGVEQDDKIGEYKFALKSIDPFAEDMVDYEIQLVADDNTYAGTLFVRIGFEAEYHTLISAEKKLGNPANLAVDGAGMLLNTGVGGAGKVLGTAGKLGGKALHGASAIGGIFKKKH